MNTKYLGVCVGLGICAGAALGAVFHHDKGKGVAIGASFGVVIGAMLGALLGNKDGKD